MQTATLTIQDTSETLDPTALGEFLFLFRGVNVALSRIVPRSCHERTERVAAKQENEYKRRLASFAPSELDEFFKSDTEPNLLRIQQIRRDSPMQIVLIGCPLLIVLAVVFSGGKVSFLGGLVKAELPPLGTGIMKLREALSLSRVVKASFGVKSTSIKLSKEEYKALVEEPHGQGGFQNLLHRLQNRVNRQTRELELSPQDLERIYRYKSDPKKGGFQGRFKKIFGRHFPNH